MIKKIPVPAKPGICHRNAFRGLRIWQYMKRGRPKKPESEKAKTTKPSLRISKVKWEKFKNKFPRKVNKMFNDWVQSQIK